MSVKILQGDVRDQLATLPDQSVHCVVTSPPYYGLRDYQVAGQIGLEDSPAEFIATLVDVFREVRRVLRSDGTAWVNMGDSYAANRGYQVANAIRGGHDAAEAAAVSGRGMKCAEFGLKPKDKMLIPHRLAIALCDDGWYVRDDIVWAKPNPMPESVRDRCTKAHEYIFLLAKSERYYFDADAIAESASSAGDPDNAKAPDGWDAGSGLHGSIHQRGRDKGASGNKASKPSSARGCPEGSGSNVAGSVPWEGITRNKRSVWTVATKPFKEAHFATFPPDLIEPCILAGCPAGGTVLDPFGGAGTTGLVSDRHGRNAILIELNPTYADMAKRRIVGDAPLFAEVS